MLVTMSVNAQWIYQYTSNQYALLNKIQFPSNNTGYAVGEQPQTPRSVFLKTTNGGINWINMNISLSFPTDLIEMSFVNENTGYICGRSIDIYKTTNGGLNWVTIPVPYYDNQIWNSMQFLDANTGFVAGRYGLSVKTTNGGLNWTSMDTAYSSIYDLYFLNASTGFMGDGSSYVLKTTNGGINWTSLRITDTNGTGYSLQKIYFNNTNTGYIVGINTVTGAVFKTTDSGTSWSNILITPYGLLSIMVVNDTKVYAGSEYNIIYYSSNSGLSWTNQTIQTASGITSIFFINNTSGYLTVANEIYKTTNGGVGVINISTEIPNEFKLFQNYPNPFNSSTKIKFQINKKDRVKILLFDIKGAEISPEGGLVNEYLEPGVYEYLFNSDNLTSGLYFCKLVTNNYNKTIKLMIIK